jgi:hypothetical protein
MRKNKIIVLSCILLLMSGCFPSRAKRRSNRAERKVARARELNPAMFATDTITVYDTVLVKSHSYDTIHSFVQHDTVTVINNERAIVKYFYDSTTTEIWHEVECKADTIVRETRVPYETITVVDSTIVFGNLFWYSISASLLLMLIFMTLLIKRRN